ncbi:large ribosomal subunit protein uL30m isoform 1-T2 [Aulostomus maculatus]
MLRLCHGLTSPSVKMLTDSALSRCPWFVSMRSKFSKPKVSMEVIARRSEEHEKYGGDPDQPHKLHLVTRVKSVKRRPYWEKEMISDLGLHKAHVPVIHKNILSVNLRLKTVKHLVRIQPLKTPYGLPSEQDIADTYINSKGELIVRRLLLPVEPKAIDS